MHWPMVFALIYTLCCTVQVELTCVQGLLYNYEFLWSTVLSILPLLITLFKWVFADISAFNNWEIVSSSVFVPSCTRQVDQRGFCQVSLCKWEMTSSSVFSRSQPIRAFLKDQVGITLFNWVFLSTECSPIYPTGNKCSGIKGKLPLIEIILRCCLVDCHEQSLQILSDQVH